MSIYKDAEMIDELRKFHLFIGKRFEQGADMCIQESVVAKLLRCHVSTIIVRLSRKEQDDWAMALVRKEPEFAETMGWTLSGDIPRLLKADFGPTFNYPAFEHFWRKHIPCFTVVDIDAPFLPGFENSNKTWSEHVVRYLHHCPLFYIEGQK